MPTATISKSASRKKITSDRTNSSSITKIPLDENLSKLVTTGEVIEERRPTISIRAAKHSGAVNIPMDEQLSELVDNAILADKKKKVTVIIEMVYDQNDDNSYIQVTDDSIGIAATDILDVLNMGTSKNMEKFALGRMGMGMKGTIWGLGEMDFVASKTTRGDLSKVIAAPYVTYDDPLIYQRVEPGDVLQSSKSGTIVKIKRVKASIPCWTDKRHFDKFVDKFNSMYANFLNEKRLSLEIYYRNGNVKFQAECMGSFPLMSNPRRILDSDINLGHNEPSYEEGTTKKIENVIIKTKNTECKVTAMHKPTPQQVADYFDKTGDPNYNPSVYKNSVFGYGHEHAGIIVKYKDKLIQFGLEKESSRETDKGVIIEIGDNSGLSFTQYKNTLVKNNNYREMMDAVDEYLRSVGFFTRSRVGTQQVSEIEIVNKFLEYVKNDQIYQKGLGIKDFDSQVKSWVKHECGETDIVIYDYNDLSKANHVIEAKKDRCDGETVSQLWRYMAHHNCYSGMILTGGKKSSSFDPTIKAFKKFMNLPDAVVEEIDIKTLNSSKFFK
jgi:hypothetical protein